MTLGVDLSDGAVRAIVVNEQAQVLARGEGPLAGTARGAAVTAAVRRALGAAGGAVERAAVALAQPGEPIPADVEAALHDLLPHSSPPACVAAGLAAVVAEHWCGAARGLVTAVTLSAGEHVTSGILLDGHPWTGSHGCAGSVGWMSINPVEREDYRRLGGLEADVSSSGIVRRIVWRIKSGDASAVADRHGGELTRITAADVFRGARDGDGVAVSVIRDTAKLVGMAVSNLAAILDPQVVVLGGVLAQSGDLLLEPIRTECGRRLSPGQAERLRIVLSPLGGDAAAIGAARLARLNA